MFKRITGIITLLILLLNIACPVLADYTVGPITSKLNLTVLESANNAQYSAGMLNISAGGSAVYGLVFPFSTVSMDIKYECAEDTELTVTVDNLVHNVTAKAAEASVNVPLKSVIYVDDHIIEFAANKNISITSVIFNKEYTAHTYASAILGRPQTIYDDEFSEILQDTVIFCENANIVKANNARRYIDYDNTDVTPKYYNGSLYVPIGTLSRALGYYYEDDPANGYYFLRSTYSKAELRRKDGKLQLRVNNGIIKNIDDITWYNNGETWLPLRYLAELLNETVQYVDGLVIIDYKYNVRDIVTNQKLVDELKAEFAKYIPDNIKGNELHVAQTSNASDDNDGSKERPFRTINKAASLAKAGDTVIVHEGTYRETLTPKNNGTAKNPIIYKAAEGEKAVLSANDPVEQIVEYKDGWVMASIPVDLGKGRNMIFYKNDALREARYPNENNADRFKEDNHYYDIDFHPLWFTEGDIQVDPGPYDAGSFMTRASATASSDTLLTEPDDFWKGGVLVAHHGWAYGLSTAEIASSTQGKLDLTNTSKIFYYHNQYEGDCAYITCTKNAIDVPGEWTIENNRLYMLPPEGETAETLKLEVKQRQLVADLTNRKYITLEGFETIGGSMLMTDSEMCVLKDSRVLFANHHTLSKDHHSGYIDEGDSTKPEAPQRGEVGIYVNGRDCAFIGNEFLYSAAAAVINTGKYCYYANNYLDQCGYMGSYVGGFTFDVEIWKGVNTPRGGHTVVGNTIRNVGRAGLQVMPNFSTEQSWHLTPYIANEIAYNDFYDCMLLTRDGGMVYAYMVSLGNDKIQSKYHHNVVWNAVGHPSHLTMGIYFDNANERTECFENIGFYTDPTYHWTRNNFVYIQTGNVIDSWDNQNYEYRPDGKDGLKREDYAHGRMFTSGCESQLKDKYPNIDHFENISEGSTSFDADDFVMSEGVINVNGRAKFTGDNQWIKFENVKVPEFGKVLIGFSGLADNTGDMLEVVMGDDIETGKPLRYADGHKFTAINASKYQSNVKSLPLKAQNPGGTESFFIRVRDYKSITIDYVEIVEEKLPAGATAKFYGGYYDWAIAGDEADYTRADETIGRPGPELSVCRVWPGSVVCYEDFEFKGDTDMMSLITTTQDQYRGVIEFRLDSPDAEPFATTMPMGSSFFDYYNKYVKLNKTVKAGTYDLYLTFNDFGTCNIWEVVFYGDGFVENDVFENSKLLSDKIYGGSYAESSNENVVAIDDYNYTGHHENAVNGIKGNTVLTYKDINVPQDADSFTISFATERTVGKGKLNVYVDSMESEPLCSIDIVEGKNTKYTYYEHSYGINKVVPAGKHDVYLVFESEDEAVSKVNWLAFSDALN